MSVAYAKFRPGEMPAYKTTPRLVFHKATPSFSANSEQVLRVQAILSKDPDDMAPGRISVTLPEAYEENPPAGLVREFYSQEKDPQRLAARAKEIYQHWFLVLLEKHHEGGF